MGTKTGTPATDTALVVAPSMSPAHLTGRLPNLDRDHLAHVIAARYLAGYSGHTRVAYGRDLAAFFTWCTERGIAVLDAERSTVDVYGRMLLEAGIGQEGAAGRPLSQATVARRLASLAGFYRYAVSERVLDRNPVEHVRRPKLGNDSPTLGLDRREALSMVTAAEDYSPRARALITLLVHTGLRISEALGADATDLGSARGHRVLNVTRKGGARRQIVLNAAVCDAIDAYLAGRDAGPLFNTRTGGRFHASEAWRLVRRVPQDACIDHAAHISPHSLRHTFVTLAREAGVPLEDVQDAAGHADPRTTRRYDRGRYSLDRSPSHALGAFLSRG